MTVMGAQKRNLYYAYLCYARGWVNPSMKITFMKKDPASYSIEWSSKKLWKTTSADVKTDVKQ